MDDEDNSRYSRLPNLRQSKFLSLDIWRLQMIMFDLPTTFNVVCIIGSQDMVGLNRTRYPFQRLHSKDDRRLEEL